MGKSKTVNDNPKDKMVLSNEFHKEVSYMLQNNLGDVLGLNTGGEIGPNFFSQLSQFDTLYKSQRWGLLSNQRQLVSQLYVENGIVSTVIDVPVDDALRGGVDITTKQLSEEQIIELQTEIETEGDIETYGQALKWKGLYGGGAVMVVTDQDPSTPLSTNELSGDSIVEFKDIDMWELNNPNFHSELDRETQIENTDEVEDAETSVPVEKLKLTTQEGCFDYYGEKIHKSRIRIMKGIKAPSYLRPRLRGWGLSELERLVRSINQFLKSTDLAFEVLDEFKLDIFKIKNLKDFMMSEKGKQAISDRVSMANQQKNYQNALTMDADDDYESKQLSFTGLAEVMVGIRMQVACDVRMPLTKIFGMSAAGFNSGEDDIENYNSMVESRIRSKSKADILWMVKIRCKQLFGFIPTDLTIAFKPLRVLSTVDEEKVKDSKHTRLLASAQAGLCSVKEYKEGCNKDDLLPVKLDTSIDKLDLTGNEFGDESEADMTDRRSNENHQRGKENLMMGQEDEEDEGKDKFDNSFDESKHPRADDGKFGNKGGSSKKSEGPNKSNKSGKSVSVESSKERITSKIGVEGYVTASIKDGMAKIHSANLNEELQGQGLGIAMYEKVIGEAFNKGLKVSSDETVEYAAVRVYEALEKRGYVVTRNPKAKDIEEGIYAPNGESVFTVSPKAKKTNSDVFKDINEREVLALADMQSKQGNDKGAYWTDPKYMESVAEYKSAVRARQNYVKKLKKAIIELKDELEVNKGLAKKLEEIKL